jgi:ATP-dependent DNA helicase DinG
MLMLADIFAADGPLATTLPGFVPRAVQLRMAEQVADALARADNLMVEAGTGTGKTFAYLVPAMLSGRRVILSTGTRTLQDQLYNRDLPALAGALGRGARIALLKGRANYLCRERLNRGQAALDLDSAQDLLQGLRDWAEVTQTGDLAELPDLPEAHPLRPRVTSTRDNCTGARCAEFARCHVFAARRAAAEADIVVVNHHLLLADLALKEEGYGDLLPNADAVILDEAHQVPDLAAQFFGLRFASRQVDILLQDVRIALAATGHGPRRLADVGDPLQLALHRAAQEIAGSTAATGGRGGWDTRTPAVEEALLVLAGTLGRYAEGLADLAGGEAFTQLQERAQELSATLESVLDASDADAARTLESTARGFTVQLLPFDVGDRFRAILGARRCAWVFTSATLSVGDDFGHFAGRLGLSADTPALRIPSPFDYERQCLLFLPPGLPEPASIQHGEAVADIARDLVEAAGGGAFLLFTSHRALERAARLLRTAWRDASPPFRLLVQGEAPRELLLREFRAAPRAVLLGTSSFWEGVDVKGDALRLVIIDKLPFASPDDPLTRARLEHLRTTGGNPFGDHQLPEAAIALKQGVGRLIRSETDSGVVVICDPRLTTRAYGKLLIRSLPPMRPTRDADEVRRFLTRLRPAGAVRVPA